MDLATGFLKDSIKRFRNYKELGEKTLTQLSDQELHYLPTTESNSIALIIQHLHGNMLSRWTNFLTEDGEKSWRQRDAEFEIKHLTGEEIHALWDEGWNCLLQTLESLQPGDLLRKITIRTESIDVYDAILRQLAHYSYHVGQIVYLGKMIRNEAWTSLSIPKGQSQQYLQSVKKGETRQP